MHFFPDIFIATKLVLKPRSSNLWCVCIRACMDVGVYAYEFMYSACVCVFVADIYDTSQRL